MSYQEASRAVEDYITSLFRVNPKEKVVYHNFDHTRKVAGRASEIGLFYKLDDEQLFIVCTSAWFHDIGYLFSGPKEHEREGVRLMKEFLSDIISEPRLIADIGQCILATKRSVSPVSITEKIICDADTYHFGTTEFKQTDSLMRREIELQTGLPQTAWISNTIRMLKNHQFYTSYCKERLEAGKERNIAWLESML
jgi:predicted metal-dependent HD superfamily phosphohydrolase